MTALSARFHFSRDSFDLEVDLGVPAGVTGILGPSGAGKTTLLRVITGLEACPGAEVRLGDVTWQSAAPQTFVPTHRRGIGFVFQEPSLFAHLTVRENLEYGLRRTPPASHIIGMEHATSLLGLEPLLGRPPGALSGGERQRVAIARALLAGPRLLCLDEPLANVDPEQRHDVLTYLERLPAEIAIPILYVSHHREEVVRLADYLVLLDTGRIRKAGALLDVLTDLGSPLAHSHDAGVVLEGIITAHDDRYALTTMDIAGTDLLVSRIPGTVGSRARVRIAARDVSIALGRPEWTSILNVLPAEIAELADAGHGQSTVRLRIGGYQILARITHRSVDRLELAPGRSVFAQIKGVAVVQ